MRGFGVSRRYEVVEWVDSWSITDRWVTPDSLEKERTPMSCMTVGWVVREDEESVLLAQSFALNADGELEEWGHVWGSPKVAIRSREPFLG